MLRVLVVDDSATERKLLTTILNSDTGIEVIGEAVNGAEAVSKVQALDPDLITMDVVMPDMDGVEAARRILKIRKIPILIVTAHSDSTRLWNTFEVMKAGALDVLGKPTGGGKEEIEWWARELVRRIESLAGVSN